MDSRERSIYAGALDGNSINDLNDRIRVAEQVSDYILIPNVNSGCDAWPVCRYCRPDSGRSQIPRSGLALPWTSRKSVRSTMPSMVVRTPMLAMCSQAGCRTRQREVGKDPV